MKYAVMGTPVGHSLSPRIHRAFAEQFGNPNLDYTAIEVQPGGLRAALEAFVADGGVGANITSPLKHEALSLSTNLTTRAVQSNTVNTLTWDAATQTWSGDVTDGIGLIKSLTGHYRKDLRERRTLLLGAGGAAHGILPALVDAGVGEIIVVNRDEAKANKLADRCGLPGRVNTRRVEQLKEAGSFDLIINTISDDPVKAFNLTGDLMAPRALVVDLNYGARASHLKAWSQAHDAPLFVDGLAMLIEQAAESFAIWHNSSPDTAPVYELLEGK